MSSSPLVAAAGDYLTRGLAVIALTGKTPNVAIHKHGLHQALSGAPDTQEDWDLLVKVFEHPDTTGIGILTSFPYIVVDIDGDEGAQQWVELVGEPLAYDTARWVAKTGRGLHLWYGTTQPTGTIKLGPKLDLKGDGGYVAAPPSLHPDGHRYEWLLPPGAEAPFEAPEPLARRIEDHVADLRGRLRAKEVRMNRWGPRYTEDSKTFYAQPNHDALIEAVLKAEEGNRNNMLHWAAATLSEEGGTEEEFEALEAAAIKIGLEPVETRRTLRSARRND